VAVRAVIIGGGVVGCVTAIKLKESGYDVTVVDKSVVGEESSAAGAGIIFPLMPWNYEARVYQLCSGALEFYKDLSKKLIKGGFGDPEFIESGMICIEPSDKKEIMQWAKKNNFKINKCFFNNRPSFELANVAQLNPKKLMISLKHYIEGLGIKLIENCNLKKIQKKSNYLNGWPTDNNDLIEGDIFIITAGAWSSHIINNDIEEIYPVRGQLIKFKKTSTMLDKILYSKNFYLLQRKCGSIVAGSTIENVGFNNTTTFQAAKELKEKTINLIPELKEIEPYEQWAGLRPGVKNNIPLIQKDSIYKNIYINSGHFRYGITMAPKSADEILKLIQV
jgi:glycine oxidase